MLLADSRCPGCGERVGPSMVQIMVHERTWHQTCYESIVSVDDLPEWDPIKERQLDAASEAPDVA